MSPERAGVSGVRSRYPQSVSVGSSKSHSRPARPSSSTLPLLLESEALVPGNGPICRLDVEDGYYLFVHAAEVTEESRHSPTRLGRKADPTYSPSQYPRVAASSRIRHDCPLEPSPTLPVSGYSTTSAAWCQWYGACALPGGST